MTNETKPTRAEILSATHEQLRLWCAEYIDGWQWFPGIDGYEFFRRESDFNYGVVRKDGVVTASYLGNIPNYPADISAAWAVLEKMRKDGWFYSLVDMVMLNEHLCSFFCPDFDGSFDCMDEKPEIAIIRAALLARNAANEAAKENA